MMRFFGMLALVVSLPLGVRAQCEGRFSVPESVPVEWWLEFGGEEAMRPPRAPLTIVPVTIDPLGAVGVVPWTVHSVSLNVRSQPTTSSSVVGSLSQTTSIAGDYYLVVESDEEWLQVTYLGQPRWISRTGVTRVHPTNQANIASQTNLPIGGELVNRWWGIPMSYVANDLVTVPAVYTTQVSGRQYLLRSETTAAVVAMFTAAAGDGVGMLVGSPYRSGASQKQIYDSAVSSDGLSQRYSAPPGHSEHQLGTTLDITDPLTGGFLTSSSAAYQWMVVHGADYGFRQSYTPTNVAETGYIEEPWHWRYIGVTAAEECWIMY